MEGGFFGFVFFCEDGMIIGQFFGGGSVNCDDLVNDLGFYGQFFYFWINDDDLLLSDVCCCLDVWLDFIGQGSICKMIGIYDLCEVLMVYFNVMSVMVLEEVIIINVGCCVYIDYEYQLGIMFYFIQFVDVLIQVIGFVVVGLVLDYELLMESVFFNNVMNSQIFIVWVYDDVYLEGDEYVQFFFIVDGGSLNVGVLDVNGM